MSDHIYEFQINHLNTSATLMKQCINILFMKGKGVSTPYKFPNVK